MTKDEARNAWQEFCWTRRMRPGVPEAGGEALEALLEGGAGPEGAVAVLKRAADAKEYDEKKMRALKAAVESARAGGKAGEALERTAWEAIGEKPPAPEKVAPKAAEKPGARWFAAGEGPAPAQRWTGGDLDRADVYASWKPGGFVFTPDPAAKAERYLVYLMKDASTWWSSKMESVFKGTDDYFLLGCAIVPSPGQTTFAIVDRNGTLEWKAAYVFLDLADGKRVQLAPNKAQWVPDPGAAELRGAIEVPRGYKP